MAEVATHKKKTNQRINLATPLFKLLPAMMMLFATTSAITHMVGFYPNKCIHFGHIFCNFNQIKVDRLFQHFAKQQDMSASVLKCLYCGREDFRSEAGLPQHQPRSAFCLRKAREQLGEPFGKKNSECLLRIALCFSAKIAQQV